jgi:hypothetical protein
MRCVPWVDATGNVIVRRQLKRYRVLSFFLKATAVPLGIEAYLVPSLVARTAGCCSYGTPNAASLGEAPRQAEEEECRRR